MYLPDDGSSPLAGPSPHYLIHGVLWLCPRRSIGAVRFPLPVLPCVPPVDLVVSLAASGCVPRRPSVARPQVPGVPVIVALSARLSRIASRPVWIGRGLIGDAKPTAAACVWWSGLQSCQGCSRASCALRRRPFSSRAHWRLEMSGSVRRPPTLTLWKRTFVAPVPAAACSCRQSPLPHPMRGVAFATPRTGERRTPPIGRGCGVRLGACRLVSRASVTAVPDSVPVVSFQTSAGVHGTRPCPHFLITPSVMDLQAARSPT